MLLAPSFHTQENPDIGSVAQGKGRGKSAVGTMLCVCVECRAVTLGPMLGSGQTAEHRRIIPFVVSEGIRTKPAEAKRCQRGLGQQQPHPAVYSLVSPQAGEDLAPLLSSYA